MAEKDPKFGDIFGGFAQNIAFAFGLSLTASWVIKWLGLGDETASGVYTALLIMILFANPLEAYRETKSRREFWNRLAIGAFLGLAVTWLLDVDLFGEATAEPSPEAEDDDAPWSKMLGMLPIILLLPLMMFAPFLETLLNKKPGSVSATDLKISMVFPIYLLITMALNLAVLGALWLIDASLQIGLLIALCAVLISVAEAWSAPEDEQIPDGDNDPAPPETVQEALAGLWKGLRHSLTSALFLGSILYVSLQAMLPILSADPDAQPARWMIELIAMIIITPILVLVLLGAGILAAAFAAYLLGRRHGVSPFEIAALCRQASDRLLMGGMAWVTPKILDDD